jgi:hypothetical protein
MVVRDKICPVCFSTAFWLLSLLVVECTKPGLRCTERRDDSNQPPDVRFLHLPLEVVKLNKQWMLEIKEELFNEEVFDDCCVVCFAGRFPAGLMGQRAGPR